MDQPHASLLVCGAKSALADLGQCDKYVAQEARGFRDNRKILRFTERTDLMQKAPLVPRRRIYIRREGANGGSKRKYNKISRSF